MVNVVGLRTRVTGIKTHHLWPLVIYSDTRLQTTAECLVLVKWTLWLYHINKTLFLTEINIIIFIQCAYKEADECEYYSIRKSCNGKYKILHADQLFKKKRKSLVISPMDVKIITHSLTVLKHKGHLKM